MAALLLILLFGAIAATFGRTLLDRMGLPALHALERLAYAAALGLGIAAYGVYALGLAGLLSFVPVTVWWLLLTLAGLPGLRSYGRDFRLWRDRRSGTSTLSRSLVTDSNVNTLSDASTQPASLLQSSVSVEHGLIVACGLVLLIFGSIAVLACFRPPGPLEWDALAYHLADPKLFLLQHRIPNLPTEHHSNFPFTMEMLFTVGLLYNGYALANLFHLLMAALTLAGMIGFCSRTLRPVVGWLSAVIFFTTPMVLWESSVAYIDVGLACFTTLSAFAAVSASGEEKEKRRKGEKEKRRYEIREGEPSSFILHPSSFLMLSGLLMGFALGMKYLALVPFGLTVLLLLLARVPARRVLLFVAVAALVGSPWYIKNAVVMGNPVYPFVTKVFPHSRYWSADRAAAYQTEQDKFGTKPLSTDVRGKLLNLMQAPWHLLTRPNPWLLLSHPELKTNVLYCNPGEFNFAAIFGGLYAALVLPLAFVRRVSPSVRFLLWLGAGQMCAWFVLSQVGRYLIQVMPLFAIAGAYAAWRLALPATVNEEEQRGDARGITFKPFRVAQLPGLLGVGAIFGQALYVLLSVCTLPMNATGQERVKLAALGQMTSSVSVPALVANLGQTEAWQADLRRRFDAYKAIEWINQNTPQNAGIALVDETRGFYLDRPYLWANQQHSSYIPYETLQNGVELSNWFRAHGIRYVLVNLNLAAQNNGATRDARFPDGPNHVEEDALNKWYGEEMAQGSSADRGHQLMGDAIKRSLWPTAFEANGCIVLQINLVGEKPSSESRTGGQNEPFATP